MSKKFVDAADEVYVAINERAQVIDIEGSLADYIHKGVVSYRKFKKLKTRYTGLAVAGLGGVAFGPIGWIITPAFIAAQIYGLEQAKKIEAEFYQNPFADLAERVSAEYSIVDYTDGELHLRRS